MKTVKLEVPVQDLLVGDIIMPDSCSPELRRVVLKYAPPQFTAMYAVLTADGLQRSWPVHMKIAIARASHEKAKKA